MLKIEQKWCWHVKIKKSHLENEQTLLLTSLTSSKVFEPQVSATLHGILST